MRRRERERESPNLKQTTLGLDNLASGQKLRLRRNFILFKNF